MAAPTGFGNWQEALDSLLQESKHDGLLSDFQSLCCDTDRVKFIIDKKLLLNVRWLKVYFRECCSQFHTKSAEKAVHHRNIGNQLFQKKNYQAAAVEYTKSVQSAVLKINGISTDLALAYGNRSAVLFHQHQYQECLIDIDRALAAGFPVESVHKLHLRRCRCFVRLGHSGDAAEELNILHQLVDETDNKRTKETILKELQQIEKERMETGSLQEVNTGVQSLADLHVSYSQNNVLVQASSAVFLKTSHSRGRYLEAKHDIKPGDTLIVERPFAAVLLPDHYNTHCHNCFVKLPANPIGCQWCSHVLFCNEDCRDTSWRSYHCVECPYLDLLHSVGIAHLSLRIVVRAGLDFLLDFLRKEKEQKIRPVPGLTPEGRYERNYLSVFDLMTHTDGMMVEDLLQYSLTSALLLAILVHSGWLNSSSTPPSELNTCNNITAGWKEKFTRLLQFIDDETADVKAAAMTCNGSDKKVRLFAVGGLLLRHVQQLVCNAHAITALHIMQTDKESTVQLQSQVRVATAIYPTASLMNHSCDPTIMSSFHKDILVVKSVKAVPAGGEIFNCYGPHCKRMKREERQEILKTQYFFHCNCEACLGEGHEMEIWDAILCQSCRSPISVTQRPVMCPGCHVACDMVALMDELKVGDNYFTEGIQYLQRNNYQCALSSLKSCLRVREKLLAPGHHDLGQVHDAMAQCFALTGKYRQAADHLLLSVASTEATFGANSVELARELHKMAEVQVSSGCPKEALTSATRALQLARTHCAESDDWVQELLCFQAALMKLLDD